MSRALAMSWMTVITKVLLVRATTVRQDSVPLCDSQNLVFYSVSRVFRNNGNFLGGGLFLFSILKFTCVFTCLTR